MEILPLHFSFTWRLFNPYFSRTFYLYYYRHFVYKYVSLLVKLLITFNKYSYTQWDRDSKNYSIPCLLNQFTWVTQVSNYYANEYLYIAQKVEIHQQRQCLKVLQLRYLQESKEDAVSSEICLPLQHVNWLFLKAFSLNEMGPISLFNSVYKLILDLPIFLLSSNFPAFKLTVVTYLWLMYSSRHTCCKCKKYSLEEFHCFWKQL